MAWTNIINAAACVTGIFALMTAAVNHITSRRYSRKPEIFSGPMVSVLIPARDEEKTLGPCLASLLDQSYTDYEIIVLDDSSRDGTLKVINDFAGRSPRVRLLAGSAVPEGWYGKNYGLHRLAGEAQGELLLITDADTVHHRDSIAFAVTNMVMHKVDFLSGYPRQKTASPAAAAVVSLMYLNLLLLTQLWLQRRFSQPAFSLVLGQFLCIRTEAYRASGGYSAIPRVLTDDIHIGRLLARCGYRQLFLTVSPYVSCTSYGSLGEAFSGIEKCTFDFLDQKTLLLSLMVFLFFFSAVLPAWVLILQLVFQTGAISAVLYIGTSSLLLGWSIVLAGNSQPLYTALLFPFSFALLIVMLVHGAYATLSSRGFVWKNRIVK
jgi:chlorobactene glucosyltransferase